MARKSRQDEIFEALRARGLRKRVARTVAEATARTNRRTPKGVKKVTSDLRSLAREIEDRATGGPAKRKAAAKKAANTRKRKANARSTAAKKAAKTRAKNSSSSSTRRRATAGKK
ncbi:MAG: hypothetical protein QOH13_1221 [Thermoleophilaceae bacterium]|nr:hypothetical protein [Thermoleophilaceae bacterium]